MQPLAAGDALGVIYGINVRDFPGVASQDPLGTSTPPVRGGMSVLKRGYINVQLNGSTAAVKGGTVYVRVASPSAASRSGGFEAAADSTNTVALAANVLHGPGRRLRQHRDRLSTSEFRETRDFAQPRP